MSTRAVALSALLFVLGVASARAEVPVYRWGQTFGSSDRDEVSDIAVDDAGYLYATGIIRGDGEGVLYVAKYRPGDHHLVWIDYLRGDVSRGTGIAVDPSGGSVYVVGQFRGRVSFNPLWGQPDRTCTCPLASSQAGLVIRYNADGQVQWVHALDGTDTDRLSIVQPRDIAYLGGYLTVVGSFWHDVDVDEDGDADLTSKGQTDGFVLSMFATDGAVRWSKQIGGENDDEVFATAFAATTSVPLQVAVVGFTQSADLKGSPEEPVAFLISYDWDGALIWTVAREDAFGIDVASDGGDAFYFLTQSDRPILGGSTDPRPAVLAKHEASSGGRLWSRVVTRWGHADVTAVAADRRGNAYVTGFFDTTLEMDGDHLVDHRPRGLTDVFFSSYAPNGIYRWSASAGGRLWDVPSAIAVTGDDAFYIGGSTASTNFDANGDDVTDLTGRPGSALLLYYEPQGFWLGNFDFICDEIDCWWFVPIELISGTAEIEFGASTNLEVSGVFVRDDLKPSLFDVTGEFRIETKGCEIQKGGCLRLVRTAKLARPRLMVRVAAKDPRWPVSFSMRATDAEGRTLTHPEVVAELPPCGPPPAAKLPWPPGKGVKPQFPPGMCKRSVQN